MHRHRKWIREMLCSLQMAPFLCMDHAPCIHSVSWDSWSKCQMEKTYSKNLRNRCFCSLFFSLFSLQSSISYELMMEIKFSVSIYDGLMQRSPWPLLGGKKNWQQRIRRFRHRHGKIHLTSSAFMVSRERKSLSGTVAVAVWPFSLRGLLHWLPLCRLGHCVNQSFF